MFFSRLYQFRAIPIGKSYGIGPGVTFYRNRVVSSGAIAGSANKLLKAEKKKNNKGTRKWIVT